LADSPLFTLARVLGGVILMQGRLGHQVLGQLLVTDSNEVAIAGASLVVAATTGQRSAVGQMALRTLAPALAVRILLNQQEERLEQKALRLADRERALDKRKAELRKDCDEERYDLDDLQIMIQRAQDDLTVRQSAVVHAETDIAARRADVERVEAEIAARRARPRAKPPKSKPRPGETKKKTRKKK